MVAIKLIFHPQPTGSINTVEVSFKGVRMEFYQPQAYFDGLPGSPNLRVKEAFEKGVDLKEKFKFSAAIKEFEKALTFQPTDEEKGALFILIGNCFYNLSKYDEANEHYQKGMALTMKIGNQAGLATTYNNIGLIYDAQGDYPEALEWYKKSLKILRQTGNNQELAVFLKNIGLLYKKMGKKEETKKHLQESQRLFKELGLEK